MRFAPTTLPAPSVMKLATPFPLEANGRSVALTGMVPSSRAKTRIKLLMMTKRFMMISFNINSKFGPYRRCDPYVLKWSIMKRHHIRFKLVYEEGIRNYSEVG